ncbi:MULTISPECIES: STAS domain-containing protein [unclassified Streptomyces]|uniref:STAS domain-containing protein n=1 Tax=unclassified Streptomyces TaxID=2593676 RepID=UPI00332C4E6B
MSENTLPGPAPAVREADGATVVALNGEIDLLAVDALARRLDTLTAGPHPDLVLDLRPATFIDCAGLGVLCRTRNRTLARRGRLRLVADDSTGFLRMLRLAGLGGVFEVHTRLPGNPDPGPRPAA